MWLILLFLWQETPGDAVEIEPNAVAVHLFMKNGDRQEISDAKIKGADPYSIALKRKGETIFISLLNITRIIYDEKTKDYEVLLDDGRIEVGDLPSFTITGHQVSNPEEKINVIVRNVSRIHVILANQQRYCVRGHYEAYTPFPYCPVCGLKLIIGSFGEETEATAPPLPKIHLLKPNPRN